MMKRVFLVALFVLGTSMVVGCESAEENCVRACDRWVNQCGRWNWTDCMSECTAAGGWGEYTDCIEQAPCDALDAWCDDTP